MGLMKGKKSMEKMFNNQVTYKDIRSRQQADLKSKLTRNMIYRKFSTPFTYLFVKMGISAPSVSIINILPVLIGYYLLSLGTYYSIIFGILFFILFKVLDCSDGEVARIQNPKAMEGKYRNMEGAYFDAVVEMIYPVCLGMGFGIGLYRLYNNELYLILGVLLSILLVLEFGLIAQAKAYFRRGMIDRRIKITKSDKEYQNEFGKTISDNKSFAAQNLFIKIFGIYPYQGWLYLGEFVLPIALLLSGAGSYIEAYLTKIVPYGFAEFGLISLYLILTTFAKLVWTILFIYNMKEKKDITEFLNKI